jgi:hypothetical protein
VWFVESVVYVFYEAVLADGIVSVLSQILSDVSERVAPDIKIDDLVRN